MPLVSDRQAIHESPQISTDNQFLQIVQTGGDSNACEAGEGICNLYKHRSLSCLCIDLDYLSLYLTLYNIAYTLCSYCTAYRIKKENSNKVDLC